jgi:[ribosomal protein S5]-alanine N-acetyltransferase
VLFAVPELCPVIHAPRLDLVLMSPALMRALLAADWDAADRLLGARVPDEWHGEYTQWLSQRLAQAEHDPAATPWLPRALLRRGDERARREAAVVGDAGFHGPPDADGRVEIGYQVVFEHRRHGYAEEAVRALMAWAAEQGVTRFRACISPQNTPSLNLIRKLGFVQVTAKQQELSGQELTFHHDTENTLER